MSILLLDKNGSHGDCNHTSSHQTSGWWFQNFPNFHTSRICQSCLIPHLLNAYDPSMEEISHHFIVLIFSNFLSIFLSNWMRIVRDMPERKNLIVRFWNFLLILCLTQTATSIKNGIYLDYSLKYFRNFRELFEITCLFGPVLVMQDSCITKTRLSKHVNITPICGTNNNSADKSVWSCIGYAGLPHNQNRTKQSMWG